MTSISRVLPVAAALLAVAAVGCGSSSSSGGTTTQKAVDPNGAEVSPPGDIPDNQAFVAYTPPGGGYSVKVPEGWARTSAGGAITFTDKLNSVRMESRPATKAPTVASYKRAEEPAVAKCAAGYRPGPVTTVSRAGGTAVRAVYYASSAPDQVTGKVTTDTVERYEYFKSGTEVVLTLSGPKGADNVDPWKLVTDSLRFAL